MIDYLGQLCIRKPISKEIRLVLYSSLSMNTKKLMIIIIAILSSVLLFFVLKNKTKNTDTAQTSSPPIKDQQTFIVDGYPIDTVPLYKLTKVSSNKIFVNTDPKNVSEFDEKNFAYFNVVFETEANQEEFFDYYKKLFDKQIADDSENRQMVTGQIGEYKVSAAHYGSGNTGYIQVHLPKYNDEKIDKYFVDFPQILELNANLMEHEKSYGLLNQKGGEVEYTKYFTVLDSGDQDKDGKDDIDEFLILEKEYQKLYKDKPEYLFDEKTGQMNWKDGDFESTLSISRDHGRIYLMLRKKI